MEIFDVQTLSEYSVERTNTYESLLAEKQAFLDAKSSLASFALLSRTVLAQSAS